MPAPTAPRKTAAKKRAQPTATTGMMLLSACLNAHTISALRRTPKVFFETEHEQAAYDLILHHSSTYGAPPSPATVRAAGIALPVTVPEGIDYYADKLRERYVYNRATSSYTELGLRLRDRDIAGACEVLSELTAQTRIVAAPTQVSSLSEQAQLVYGDYQLAKAHPGLRGVTLGWSVLDEATLGAEGGDLIVIAGRTGVGKSWILANMAHAAWLMGNRVLFVTMEMGLLQISRRLVGLHSRINPNFIRAGELSNAGEAVLLEHIQELSHIGSSFSLVSGDFEKKVGGLEALIAEHEFDVVYIDAAYLLTAEGVTKGYVSKWESISLVIAQLKKIALRTGKPIILSVQLNRNVKKNSPRDIDTTDVSGSDSIPQDASILIGAQVPPPPLQTVQRKIQVVKGREGGEISFNINYRFSPVDFSVVPENFEAASVDWMA